MKNLCKLEQAYNFNNFTTQPENTYSWLLSHAQFSTPFNLNIIEKTRDNFKSFMKVGTGVLM